MSGQSYRDLTAWRKAIDLVEIVYRITQSWPREELYGLTAQTRRAAVSIPANVAEGQGRHNDREFLRFAAMANGSLHELETHLVIGRRLHYMDEPASATLAEHTAEVGRLLNGLMNSLRNKLGAASNAPTDY